MQELPATVTIDHTGHLQRLPDTTYNRRRSIHLRIAREGDRHLVQAWGSVFPEDGAGSFRGWIHTDPRTLAGGVNDLRAAWQRAVIDFVQPGSHPVRRPFVDGWDLAGPDDRAHLRHAGLTLARAGHTLFTLLFHNGDSGLKEIAVRLVEALRSGEQVITVESDHLFVPWGMLYFPACDDDNVWAPDYQWAARCFWGYQHLLEHNFSRVQNFDSRMLTPDLPRVGLNVDERVDADFPPTPCVRPVVDFFATRAEVTVRNTKSDLAAALSSHDFDDDVLYFGCHGRAEGAEDSPHLVLSDDEKIYAGDFVAWLAGKGMPSRPVVFVGACQGGQLASMFYPTFGLHLLRNGARCLIGPQVDLPRAFAGEYAVKLFTSFLANQRLGDAVRDLARSYLDDHHNPLGLIFSLYRGIDVHLERSA